jgi:MFS family permease
MLAMGVFVFDVTGSPIQVALVSILRMVPLALCGIPAGALLERFPRTMLVRVGLFTMTGVSVALALLALAGKVEVWHLAVGALLNGAFWVIEMPGRRTLIAEMAGDGQTGRAMALEATTSNGTRMLGPLLGGLLLEVLGLDGTFLLTALLYGAAILVLPARESQRSKAPAAAIGVLSSLVAGVSFAAGDRTLRGILAVTLIFNLWAFPVVTMIPVFGKDVLGLSAFPVGLLSSAEGAGAFLGALVLSFRGRPARYRQFYVWGVAVYMLMSLAFAQSETFLLSVLLILGAGLGGAAFSATQSTLVLLNSPLHARNRIMGVLMVCIGVAPIGFAHLGFLVGLLGPASAISLCAVEGMIALAFALFRWPELLRAQDGSD